MNIIERTYSLNGGLSNRNTTNRIILHHAAVSNCSADDVDRWHKNKGWTCIGYHFFVRKDGAIYRGRREEAVGAHAYGSNTDSIGICAEGNFENETMGDVQKQALKELVAYLKNKYGITIPKKTGTAVIRNKIKRRVKNIIDNNKNIVQKGYDYVIIVKKGIVDLTYQDMEKELLKLLSMGD